MQQSLEREWEREKNTDLKRVLYRLPFVINSFFYVRLHIALMEIWKKKNGNNDAIFSNKKPSLIFGNFPKENFVS